MDNTQVIEEKVTFWGAIGNFFSSSKGSKDEEMLQKRIEEIKKVQNSSYIEELTQDYERHEIEEKDTRRKTRKTVQAIRREQQVVATREDYTVKEQEEPEQEL